MRLRNQKAQAVAEMALFGSLILIVLVTLLSYVQRMNDQQYVQMEAFRRALEKACTYAPAGGGAGAAAQVSLVENRKHVDLSGNLGRGQTSSSSGSASVFWAVPFVGQPAEQAVVLRANEDEENIDNAMDFAGVGDISTHEESSFTETVRKDEDTSKIVNSQQSTLSDSITTTFEDGDGGELWSVTQGAYRDGGQYKYKSGGGTVSRQRRWETPH